MLALLTILLSQASPVPDVDGPIYSNPATMGGTSNAYFEFAPASGAGMGEVCASPNWISRSEEIGTSTWSNDARGTPSPGFIVVTADQVASPTGTLTADQLAIPATSGTGMVSRWNYVTTTQTTIAPWIGSCYVRGNVPGSIDLWTAYNSNDATTRQNAVCSFGVDWTRCSSGVLAPTATSYTPELHVGSMSPRAAQTVYVWGCMLERAVSTPSTYVASTTAAAGAKPTGAKGETMTFTRSGAAVCTKTATGGLATTGIADGDLVFMPTNAPRVEYDSAGTKGLLVEGARTNSTLRSQELNNAAWASNAGTVSVPTITADAATAPDGTTTAERIQFPAVTGSSYSQVYQVSACPAGTQVGSVYLRGNASAGTLALKLGTACAACTYVADSWSRCTPTINSAASLTFAFGSDATSCVGAQPALDVFVWGAQCEAGAYATSYIPTTSAAFARSAEVAQFDLGASAPYANNASMAVTAELTGEAQNAGVPGLMNLNSISFGDASGTGALWIYGNSVTTTASLRCYASGAATGFVSHAFGAPLRSWCAATPAALTASIGGNAATAGGAVPTPASVARYMNLGGSPHPFSLGGIYSNVCVDSPTVCR